MRKQWRIIDNNVNLSPKDRQPHQPKTRKDTKMADVPELILQCIYCSGKAELKGR